MFCFFVFLFNTKDTEIFTEVTKKGARLWEIAVTGDCGDSAFEIAVTVHLIDGGMCSSKARLARVVVPGWITSCTKPPPYVLSLTSNASCERGQALEKAQTDNGRLL
jgi:hypothetical protein